MWHQTLAVRRAGILVTSLLLFVTSYAQTPEQLGVARYTISTALRNLNVFSAAYLEYVASREKDGLFVLTSADLELVLIRLSEFQKGFSSLSDDEPIEARLANPEVRTQVHDALLCSLCGRDFLKSKMERAPQTARELKDFMFIRLTEIIVFLKSQKPTMPKDQILQLERQIFYLRQITIAYL
jgi:hypothetical protein